MKLEREIVDQVSLMSTEVFAEFYRRSELENKNELKKLEKNPDEKIIDHAKRALLYRMATDIELFSDYYFAHFCEYPYNEFHYDVFENYKYGARKQRRLRGAPRGYAKSTHRALIEPIHDFCYEQEVFTLIISATKPQSTAKIKDIRTEFFNNTKLVDDFDIRFERTNPGETEFVAFAGEFKAKFQGVGIGSETRGIRFGSARPSKLIFDDVEDSEEVYNEELRDKLADRYMEDFTKLGNKETNIDFVGTVLHKKSLLKKLEKNPSYDSRIYKAVISWADNKKLWNDWEKLYINLDNPDRKEDALKFFRKHESAMLKGTEVLWPDYESYYELMEEQLEIGRRAFAKEKQNDPIADEDALFERILWYHEEEEGLRIEHTGGLIRWNSLNAFGSLDPATGESKKSVRKTKLDYACVLGGYKDLKGRLFVHRDFTKRARPTAYIDQLFSFHDDMGFDKFVVETNLYRNLLIENIVRERKRIERQRKKEGIPDWGLKIPFYEIEQRENKEKRIYTLEPKVSNGYILFNRSLSTNFMDMVEQFPNADHDDGPDALEMLWGLVNNRYKASPLNLQAIGAR